MTFNLLNDHQERKLMLIKNEKFVKPGWLEKPTESPVFTGFQRVLPVFTNLTAYPIQ
jgi:hypothetical protein